VEPVTGPHCNGRLQALPANVRLLLKVTRWYATDLTTAVKSFIVEDPCLEYILAFETGAFFIHWPKQIEQYSQTIPLNGPTDL
jgi:hypothetical protein